MEEKLNKKVVAAIDFGTTYSGWSYAFKSKPNDIKTRPGKNGESKIPTSLLLNKNGTRHSFGELAETNYLAHLDEIGDQEPTLALYRRFKMNLNNLTDLSGLTIVTDVTGKKHVDASVLFRLSIEALKDELLDTLKPQGIAQGDIHFVLTVPAIWNDKAKHLMRFAAKEAGIKNEQLTLALESEVASVWCKDIPIDKDGRTIQERGPGTKYLLVDLGGGTADIAIHTIAEGGDLRADSAPAGGDFGANNVDKTFFQLLEEIIIGKDIFKKYRIDYKYDFFLLMEEFEKMKKAVSGGKSITLKIASDIMKLINAKGQQTDEPISGYKFLEKTCKLKLEYEFLESLFQYSIMSLMGEMESLLDNHPDTASIMVVGGFAGCKILQDAIIEKFKKFDPIFPDECSVVVLKGATKYGLRPAVVKSRKAHFTYGFEGAEGKFEKLVTVGQSIDQDFVISEVIKPKTADVDVLEYNLYSSTENDPKKVTEKSCIKLHTFFAHLPAGKTVDDKKFERSVIFGDTELMFRIKYFKTNKEHLEYISFK